MSGEFKVGDEVKIRREGFTESPEAFFHYYSVTFDEVVGVVEKIGPSSAWPYGVRWPFKSGLALHKPEELRENDDLADWEKEAKEVSVEAKVQEEADMVNHPPHYTAYEGFEVIEIVEQLDYLRGTAVKYIMRAGSKWDEAEDLKKAVWYLNRKIEKLENDA